MGIFEEEGWSLSSSIFRCGGNVVLPSPGRSMGTVLLSVRFYFLYGSKFVFSVSASSLVSFSVSGALRPESEIAAHIPALGKSLRIG